MKRATQRNILLIFAIIFLFIGFGNHMTGNIIGIGEREFSWIRIVGIFFLMGFFIMFISRKRLDVLIIPTGGPGADEVRTKRALKEWDKGDVGKMLISGSADELESSQRRNIYSLLRNQGIPPSKIILSDGRNSKENIKYAFKKMEDVGNVGIVSYDSHLDRLQEEFEEEQKKGDIPLTTRLHRIETTKTTKDQIYGTLAKIKERYHLGTLNSSLGKAIKKILDKE
jgi:hypothetical protein